MRKPKLQNENQVVWPIRMGESLKNKFKIHCDKNGYSMNKRVKVLMEEDMNGETKK
jgi:hypothetical protein